MSTILIVDDMAVVREPIAAAMQLRGHQAITAEDGIEALRLTRQHAPDVVLLDLTMPSMDGLAFLEALRRDPATAGTKVILLTASHSKATILKAINLGACDAILKAQFSLQELLRRIERQLNTPARSGIELSPAAPSDADRRPVPVRPTRPAAANPGEPTSPLKGLKPLLTRSELDAVLAQFGELQAMSPTVAKVLALTRSATCSMEQVADAVKQDHAIALKIIKLANSALYTRGDPVESVAKAVARIGLAQIRQAVLNITVIEGFCDSGIEQHISTPLFWEHSIACALISAEIVRSLGGTEAEVDAASTMGLLHDVGRMVYAKALGERYRTVLETAERQKLPLEQVESRMLLSNHAEVMDKLLHNWKCPANLINPIALHHLSIGNMRRMSPHTVQGCAVLALADAMAHAMLLGSSGNTALYPTLPFIQALRLQDDVLQRIEADVPGQTADLRLALLVRASSESWPHLPKQVRQRLPEGFQPRFVGVHGAGDPFHLLCRALTRDEREAKPSVILAHIGHVREREEVTRLIQQAEAEIGATGLPTIVVSPHGNIAPTDAVLAQRSVQLLGLPLPLARLVEAASSLGCSDAKGKAA